MNIYTYSNDVKDKLMEKLLSRTPDSYTEYEKSVQEIVSDVKQNGDKALFEYTSKFDNVKLDKQSVKVSKEEIEEAYRHVSEDLIKIMQKSIKRIESYHSKQKINSWFATEDTGSILGQKITPIESVGVYVPGGKAVYPSSVIMNVMPAKVAGVPNIIMTTPPDKNGKVNPLTLVSANQCGVEHIYKVGGAQAVAALAFGTESIPKVYKIVGPGNIFVTLAKKAVFGHVNIDSIAGPSEILVIADKYANPVYVAADLLSQAEHDELASSILVTDSEQLAKQVSEEVDSQMNKLSRKDILEKSINNCSAIVVVENIEQAIMISNEIAPEHLEIYTHNPFEILPKIKNAGSIFLGEYSPEPLGDYMAGPNHVLPTNGTAKFFSPLSVDDFIKKSSIISFSETGLKELYKDIVDFATAEQLTAHANSVRVRFEND